MLQVEDDLDETSENILFYRNELKYKPEPGMNTYIHYDYSKVRL